MRYEVGKAWLEEMKEGERRVICSTRENGQQVYEALAKHFVPDQTGRAVATLITEDIFVVTTNQGSIRLSAFLPKGTVLQSAYLNGKKSYPDENGVDGDFQLWSANESKVSYGDFTQDGKMLVFLHEAGHVWSYGSALRMKLALEELESNLMLGDSAKEGYAKVPIGIVEEHLGMQGSAAQYASEEILERFKKSYITMERDAWAVGLKALENGRDTGIDLEPGLQDIDEIRTISHAVGLESHAKALGCTVRGIPIPKN